MLKSIGLVALKEEVCIFINTKYKVFIIFYINNIQVLYYRNNKLYITKIIKLIKEVYKLYNIGDVV